ncbi:helix-turn-helix transcriptional regulator [uncultured Metabacillus sp.]|uniref:helix-turn-helix domain-containing protein n=1 Tax=uncultured Metabacillus sp. TaxID=2860135 RepID=UPI002622A94E|nr:helix-turn-helix transcriptional regulator [uncultured Metabacillus sp.]
MFANRLKSLRLARKLTQDDVAKMLGITRQGYGHYENPNSKREPDHATTQKLAEIFNVSIDYLITGEDQAYPQLIVIQNLKRAREFCGLTPEELATELGVSKELIDKWESGKIKLSENEIDLINNVFSRYSEKYRQALENQSSSLQTGIPVLRIDKIGRYEIKPNQDNPFDSLSEISELLKTYGIEDSGFFDIEEWKNLSPEDMIEVKKHFEWVAQKAKERNKDTNNN